MAAEHDFISVFDMFKIGVGPSSSHTLGPWRAALDVMEKLDASAKKAPINSITVLLYGSLAKTGKGHGTDIAVMLGLMGYYPETIDVGIMDELISSVSTKHVLNLKNSGPINFDPAKHIAFLKSESLPFHPNGLTFLIELTDGNKIAETYFSVGGGFIVQEGKAPDQKENIEVPFTIEHANDLLHWCMKTGLSISAIVFENELTRRSESEIKDGVLNIWYAMRDCMYRGVHKDGLLPGGLESEAQSGCHE